MCGLTRDGTVEPVSRDQILLRWERRQEKKEKKTCSADHEQDGNHIYPVDPNSAEKTVDHTSIHYT